MCARSSEHLLTVAVAISQPQTGILVGSAAGHALHFKTKNAGGSKDGASATNTGAAVGGTRDGDALRNQAGTTVKCRAFGTPSKVAAAVTCLTADRRLPVFVSGSTDGSVRIWDLTSWQCLRTLRFFGQGSVTALTLLVCAPLRGIAVAMQKEPRLRVAWFGAAPAATATAAVTKRQQYCENPGKASTSQDWRGTVANTRKVDTDYAAAEFRHRGTQRKERRDLAARVKDQGRSSTSHSTATTDGCSTSGRGTGTDAWWEEHGEWYEDDAYDADYLEGYSSSRAQGVARWV